MKYLLGVLMLFLSGFAFSDTLTKEEIQQLEAVPMPTWCHSGLPYNQKMRCAWSFYYNKKECQKPFSEIKECQLSQKAMVYFDLKNDRQKNQRVLIQDN